jgi:hypothetical protein
LCYHYRIISKENCEKKLKLNNWYSDKSRGYTLQHLLSSDYSDVKDETLKKKENLKWVGDLLQINIMTKYL